MKKVNLGHFRIQTDLDPYIPGYCPGEVEPLLYEVDYPNKTTYILVDFFLMSLIHKMINKFYEENQS